MPNYDRQVIVQLGFDAIIEQDTGYLNDGASIPSVIVKVHPGSGSGLALFRYADVRTLTTAFAQLTTNSRVYLEGHGDWAAQKLETYDGEATALLLASAKMPQVAVVSCDGCSLARDAGINAPPDALGDMRVANSINSYAGNLHRALKNRGIPSDVFARLFDVGFRPSGKKITFADDLDDDSEMRRQPHSKIRFYWQGETQMREWRY